MSLRSCSMVIDLSVARWDSFDGSNNPDQKAARYGIKRTDTVPFDRLRFGQSPHTFAIESPSPRYLEDVAEELALGSREVLAEGRGIDSETLGHVHGVRSPRSFEVSHPIRRLEHLELSIRQSATVDEHAVRGAVVHRRSDESFEVYPIEPFAEVRDHGPQPIVRGYIEGDGQRPVSRVISIDRTAMCPQPLAGTAITPVVDEPQPARPAMSEDPLELGAHVEVTRN